MFEKVFLWTLTALLAPIYYTLQFIGDLCHVLGKVFNSAAEGSLETAANFADFVLRRN